ncbi:uncharacterized protein LOC110678847 [Aedes aegypti]|uniref:Uncharacterized protein n=1 Tax=Aedes aegypti TaxID=7159 RepID=A0A6I8U6H2_AEDAE|nr:uncharacterized protein LOC110678847 [Aedes aegypti]
MVKSKLFIIVSITFYFTFINSLMHIHDLSNSPLAIIPLGEAKIKIGFVRIIHPIDLDDIKEVILKINKDVQQREICNSLQELIKIKNQKLYETYLKIKPFTRRFKRWDAIGSTWKWIAGSPDAEDLRIINSSINSLVNNNNQQIMINRALNAQMQGITDVTNELLRKQYDAMQNHSIEISKLIILSNLDLLQNQMETLEDAILLAKHGIPSSKLLSIHSFNHIATSLQQHDIYLSSFEELLTRSTAQVVLNSTHIVYILKIPQLSKEIYEYDYIDSIIKDEKRIILQQNFILRNTTHIFETNQPCIEQDGYYLCETLPLTYTSECIDLLIKGKHSNCSFERIYSNGIIKRINDGTILVNNAVVEVSSNCSNSDQKLNGTYLIQFEQCSLRINGELYSNFEISIAGRAYMPTTGQLVHQINIIDAPPPEYLRNLTLEHRDKLEQIHLENRSLSWKFNVFGSIGLSTVSMIIIIIIVMLYFSKLSFTRINLEMPKQEIPLKELATAPEELSNESSDELSDDRRREIESFVNMPSPYRNVSQTLSQLCGQS